MRSTVYQFACVDVCYWAAAELLGMLSERSEDELDKAA